MGIPSFATSLAAKRLAPARMVSQSADDQVRSDGHGFKEYVTGFATECDTGRVLLVRKNKPKWQRGILNGIGGKVEPGELPADAMRREFREEVGSDVNGYWTYFAKIICPLGTDPVGYPTILYYFHATCFVLPRDNGFNDAGEELEAVHLHDIHSRPDVARNLKWLLPLAVNFPESILVTMERMP
jgi:8-oxo-dGTP diphosphatase